VFKWEDRKGWRELIRNFVREFIDDVNRPVLILRTYRHSSDGLSDISARDDEYHIRKNIIEVISESDGFDIQRHKIKIELFVLENIIIVTDYLSSTQMIQFYKQCDCFVLPTHGEGWGLPTHEGLTRF
jgi:glycosyltransferase involved in cell wall biosynthesis